MHILLNYDEHTPIEIILCELNWLNIKKMNKKIQSDIHI